ncbi:hypothetical protein OEV98_05595 [Caldibacillus lycopersici]|uniref:Uncharacterized protein n=1 Tax=Perspicuibacillus lycopersici TaxID=1325689 RepID=A0AAE3ISV5_9BACI|nr:hypothetical protein [Perspicuibacillus lycopersici]MCU9613023.1 hypothetical protein [Perspicuibacillus lycopersici]
MHKRKGKKYLSYELVPMGETDRIKLLNAGYNKYSNATHWFVEIVPSFPRRTRPYGIEIYPTTNSGKTDVNIVLQVNGVKNPEDIIPLFNEIVEDMKNDSFWGTDYATLYD